MMRAWLLRNWGALAAYGIVTAIAISVFLMVAGYAMSIKWDSGTITEVSYDPEKAMVWIELDEDNHTLGPLYFYDQWWKQLRVGEHIRFRYETGRIIDFWYDNEEINLIRAGSNPAPTISFQDEEEWSWVELSRDETSIAYCRSDDNRIGRLESFGGPISYWDNGWVPINTQIVPSTSPPDPSYGWQVVEAPYRAYFAEDIYFGRVARVEKEGYYVAYQPLSINLVDAQGSIQQVSQVRATTGRPENDRFIYENVFGPGTSLAYICRNTAVKEELTVGSGVLSAPEAWMVEPVTFDLDFLFSFSPELDIYIDNAPWDQRSDVRTDNRVEFRLGDNLLFWLPAPYAYDDNGQRVGSEYLLDKVGKKLHIHLRTPHGWLADEDRAYPITLDPTTFVSSASDGDIWVYSDVSYVEAWGAAEGTVDDAQPSFNVGQEYYDIDTAISRGFLFFDTSSIGAGATVTGATLSLCVAGDQSDDDFDIVVTQSDDPDEAPHDPLEPGDYSAEWGYEENGGSIDTAGISVGEYFDIDLNATGLGWISETGTTILVLRSSQDIAVEPPAEEWAYVQVWAFEKGDGYWPMLVVEWGAEEEAAPPEPWKIIQPYPYHDQIGAIVPFSLLVVAMYLVWKWRK